jgi:hypothetical protein
MNMFRHAALAVAAGLLLNAPLHAQDASTATPQTVAPLSAHSPDADSQTLFVQDGKSANPTALSEREMRETKGGALTGKPCKGFNNTRCSFRPSVVY